MVHSDNFSSMDATGHDTENEDIKAGDLIDGKCCDGGLSAVLFLDKAAYVRTLA